MDIKHVACALQVKALGGDGVFSGYASVFGKVNHQNEIANQMLTRIFEEYKSVNDARLDELERCGTGLR
jgi:hypothetical protein